MMFQINEDNNQPNCTRVSAIFSILSFIDWEIEEKVKVCSDAVPTSITRSDKQRKIRKRHILSERSNLHEKEQNVGIFVIKTDHI